MKPASTLARGLGFALLLGSLTGCGDANDPDHGMDLDHDGDGYLESEDCDDSSPYIHPGATDTPYDGVDQDCSGHDYADLDGDGYDADFAGGTDCDDDDDRIHPNAREYCRDAVDQDCTGDPVDGREDGDGDGYIDEACTGGTDCDDDDGAIHPNASEDCGDSEDMDCDGVAGAYNEGCCELFCSCDSTGLTCGTGSISCSYSYDSYGRVSYMSCTYSNGASFACSVNWSSSGTYSLSCSGEGDSCSTGTCY